MIIAPGKRSAARGWGAKLISSFFPSTLARRRRAKVEGKKEVRCVVLYPGQRRRLRCAAAGLTLGYYHAAPSGA